MQAGQIVGSHAAAICCRPGAGERRGGQCGEGGGEGAGIDLRALREAVFGNDYERDTILTAMLDLQRRPAFGRNPEPFFEAAGIHLRLVRLGSRPQWRGCDASRTTAPRRQARSCFGGI
jgi:hypothetical protein